LQQEGSSPSASGNFFDHTVGSSIPTFSAHPVHDLSSTTNVHQSAGVSHDSAHYDSVANMSDATQPELLSHSYPAPLPKHVRLLYETTVKEVNLSDGIAADLCRLLFKHANTFAASSADLVFCRQLHSNCGKNFQGKLFAELCALTGINKIRTTPYHPRSDGQTERMNRTILQMLRTTAADNPLDWPYKIPSILAAYRMTVHSTTGLTPN